MSQIASFTYIKESDVPFLGFWSKPKSRLFRGPESKFVEWLQQHTLREEIFEATDGAYVALVFAWLQMAGKWIDSEADPVLHSVRRHVGGSHWLVKSEDVRRLSANNELFAQSEWFPFLQKINAEKLTYEWRSFDEARRYTLKRISELKADEALLVSIG